MFPPHENRTPIKSKIRGNPKCSPSLQNRIDNKLFIKKVEDSCKEMAKQKRIERMYVLHNSNSPSTPVKQNVVKEIFNDVMQDRSFMIDDDLSVDDYKELLSIIGDEYDIQYSLLLKEYEDNLSAENQFYSTLEDEIYSNEEDSIPCPKCCIGCLHETQPNYVQCSRCGMDVHRGLEQLREQIAEVYRNHKCWRVLQCELIPDIGLSFSCLECGFNQVMH